MAGAALEKLTSNCVLVSTQGAGEILIGCPPGIVKWFLLRGRPIPSFVILPRHFLIENALNVEPEFPVYGNFFIQRKKTTIIGTHDQLRRLGTVLRESFLGPAVPDEGQGERAFLRARGEDGEVLGLSDLVELVPLGPRERRVEIDGVVIRRIRPGCFELLEGGVSLGEVDTGVFTIPTGSPDSFGEKALEPPAFGVSFVGTGSGFSPLRRTTSFVLWIDGKGILVDPVIDAWAELSQLGIDDLDVPSVLLTHCHADHDAGMIRAILHRRRIRLMTSRVVFGSFQRKARALAGCDIRGYLDFIEVNPGETLRIENAWIKVSAALHSVPTIRFEATYRPGRSRRNLKIAYSGDTCLDRGKIETMYRQSIIDAKRRSDLLGFGLDADLLIHEAGQESIHTSVEEFRLFPERVRKRLVLVHTGASPGDLEGLRVAEEGETVELIPSDTSLVDKVKLIGLSSIFEDLDRESLRRLAERSVVIPFRAGHNIVNQGEEGDRFYVITRGKAKVVVGDAIKAVLGKGDYFGEMALLSGDPRSATVQAISDGAVLALEKGAFLELVQAKPAIHKRLENVLRVRPIVSQLTFLRGLSSDQLARLSIRVTRSVRRKGDRVIKEGERGDAFFVLASGEATVRVRDPQDGGRVVAHLGPGDVFGEIALLEGIPRTATVEIASDAAELLRLREKDFRRLMESIPSLSFYINRISSERLRKLRRVHREDLYDRILKELG